MNQSETREKVLAAAERLCQTRGYNGFSFRDLAELVGIRSASIHYHFPAKADLGKALIIRYRQKMETILLEIDRRESTVAGRFKRFIATLREILKDENRMCLCGILAAEAGTLSPEMKAELRRFFDECEAWLAAQLLVGRQRGELAFAGSPTTAARTMFGAVEGAMIASRAFNDDSRLVESANWMFAQMAAT
ncbi:MAG TPA: TetR/AcrR family transcriptional regulator [Tepidisphaeraceae bacterium]|nr:TetR/AcrR family transcriptional regulator [Tepidisphaeraceae bacterium]